MTQKKIIIKVHYHYSGSKKSNKLRSFLDTAPRMRTVAFNASATRFAGIRIDKLHPADPLHGVIVRGDMPRFRQ